MKIFGEAPDYCAYVLRCWVEHPQEKPSSSVQRFSLEDIHTGRRHGFRSIEALVAFLQQTGEDHDGRSQAGTTPVAQEGLAPGS